MDNMKTIMIADDHPMMIEGLSSIIHQYTPFKVIASANDGQALLHKLNDMVPDMLLLDLNMPKMNGMETAKAVKAKYTGVKIVCISMYYEKPVYDALQEIGINGFIPKLTDATIFSDTIQEIMAGKKIFINNDTGALPAGSGGLNDPFQNIQKLSEREIEVLRLIKQGLTTKEISEHLHRSEYTIETHRKNICRKLQVSSQNGLLKLIHQTGI
jgi:DNA-binding NarL/FixJ family response regulator